MVMHKSCMFAIALALGFWVTVAETDMKSSIKRDGNRVWIENVTCPRWEQGADCTYDGALSSILECLDDNVSYDDLMGWSGQAFRLQIMQPDWCPSAAC